MDYARLLASWKEAFGRENLIVRRFEAEDFPDGDLLADFAAQVPFSLEGFERPAVLNQAMNAQGIAFLREFNRHVPVMVNRRVNPSRGPIIKAVQQVTAEGRLTIPSDIAAAIEKQFVESNRKISSEYFGGRHKPLFSRPKSVGDKSVESLLELGPEQAVEIAAGIWVQMQRQIRRLQRSKAAHEGGEPRKKRRR
jgi:hypothetical protein